MNSTDLIERLDEMCATDEGTLWPHDVMQCLIDCRAALSPVMPPEVDAAIKFYRDPEQGANRITADLLEKLARELSQFQDSSFNPDWSLLEAGRESLREHMQLLKEAQQRIEELEPKYQLERQGSARMSEEILKLESQRDQLAEELEDQLQYHQEEAVTLENRIEEVVAANDKERARVNKLTSQRDQLAEALEALGDEDWWDTETMLSASDYARRQHKRIMGEK